jgi:fatty acid/phospholipid biosynthesis enzyme
LNKTVVKTHGSSEFREWIGAIGKLKEAVQNQLVEKIKKEFDK